MEKKTLGVLHDSCTVNFPGISWIPQLASWKTLVHLPSRILGNVLFWMAYLVEYIIHIQTSSRLCCKILQISCNKKNHKITVIQHANWHDPNMRKKSAWLPFYSTVHVNNLCPRYLIQKVKILCSSYLSCQKVAFNLFITPIPNYEEMILSQKLLKLWMKCYGTTIQMKLFWLIFGMWPFIS